MNSNLCDRDVTLTSLDVAEPGAPEDVAYNGAMYLASDIADKSMNTVLKSRTKRVINQSLLSSMTNSGFMGFINNDCNETGRIGNNMIFGSEQASEAYAKMDPRHGKDWNKPDFASDRLPTNSDDETYDNMNYDEGGVNISLQRPPRHLRRRMAPQHSFGLDFRTYNTTVYAGLENTAENSYCNAFLQMLFFVPELRRAVLGHLTTGTPDVCVADELGFLFHMMLMSRQRGEGGAASGVVSIPGLAKCRILSILTPPHIVCASGAYAASGSGGRGGHKRIDAAHAQWQGIGMPLHQLPSCPQAHSRNCSARSSGAVRASSTSPNVQL